MAYHARQVLLLRSAQERYLDALLDRKGDRDPFANPVIRRRLATTDAANAMFVVVASPVVEVGRDHDYDWAVVEPSSMRSLIQLAGRIRRHRPDACDSPNIFILSRNIKSLEYPGHPAFQKPGFETSVGKYKLACHSLEKLLLPEQYQIVTSCPRIL